MATVLKCIFGLFIATGICISLYGCWHILGTVTLVKNSTERTKGIFMGYYTEEFMSRTSGTNQFGQTEFYDTISFMSYPEFEFTAKDGRKIQVRESKMHLIEGFEPSQKVEIIVSPYGDHRLAGFYSLYFRDICILILGICFVFIPLAIWRVVIPSLKTPAGMEMEKYAMDSYKEISATRVGPFTVTSIFKFVIIFILFVVAVAVVSSAAPFIKQLHLGPGWGLFESLHKGRFDEARGLILKRKGINKVDEHGQSPLLLAMEAGKFDLARLLIEAGADVNIKSKMYKTPLLLAAQAGDIDIVKLLLSKGASPDAPDDELPPVFHALVKKHYEVARVLIESKCDLKRVYIEGEGRYTVGDFTAFAKQPELTELVRRRGGTFTKSP